MGDNVQKLNDVIEHYKRHIGRATESNDSGKIMKCILKLSRLPITVQNLQKTGIGRVVNSFSKYDGTIGESAESLVRQWKNVVIIEEFDSKKDKDSKKRKESFSTSTYDQRENHSSKRVKREHKYESVNIKKEYAKWEIASTSHKNNSEENINKDKKSSHSDKSKSKSDYKDKSDSKKESKDKVKEKYKPSTSSFASSNKSFGEALLDIATGKKKLVKSKDTDRLTPSSSSERESSPTSTGLKRAPFYLDPEDLVADYEQLRPRLTEAKKRKSVDDTDQLAKMMSKKKTKTKVYSGSKSTIPSEVPSLLDFSIRTIKDNFDALEYTGGVPFIILEPILKHVTPDQLYTLEHYNEYLIEDTGVLWEYHCKKEFRNEIPKKNESWRNCYTRCLEERETKLAELRQKI